MSDNSISRQAMLKYAEKKRKEALMMDDLHEASIIMAGMDLLEEAARNQPSTQTESIWCKDCKHRDAEDGFCKGRGWPMQLVPEDGFCDKGERRSEDE